MEHYTLQLGARTTVALRYFLQTIEKTAWLWDGASFRRLNSVVLLRTGRHNAWRIAAGVEGELSQVLRSMITFHFHGMDIWRGCRPALQIKWKASILFMPVRYFAADHHLGLSDRPASGPARDRHCRKPSPLNRYPARIHMLFLTLLHFFATI